MAKNIFLLALMICASLGRLVAQEHGHEHDEEEHRNHIGLATGPVYIINEDAFAPGVHLHYTYLYHLGSAQFGTGLGFEAVFDEHTHYSTSLNLSYLPIHNLTFTVAPGIQFGPNSTEFTTHFEVSYEFILGAIHLGPVLEYAYAKDDAHAMIGVHIGFGF